MTDASVREDVSLESLVARVIDEFRERQKRGERPSAAEYAARHPQAAELLRKVLASLEVLSLSAAGDGASAGAGDEPAAGTLGDYRIVREVGRGGMGIVYEAEQISLGRRVALKVLPFAATMDPRHLQRFQNEARAAASLEHPHIVPVYGVGSERGVHYYAMRFIDGRSLAELLAQQRDGPAAGQADPVAETAAQAAAPTERAPRDAAYFRRVAEWGIQAAEALEHAHSLGVVHRDIKPANLLIDGQGKLWVTDFGLARFGTDAGLTMTGDLLGTLRYMSPEQALAKHGLVDHRTDVYALGVTLYELLTLAPALRGDDRQELLRQLGDEEPRPPRRVNPAIPPDLETVVLKAMAKVPAERYATARELADDLRRFLEHQPIRARRAGVALRLQKWVQRHRTVTLAAGAGLLVTLVVLACSSLLLWREKEKVKQALAEKDTQYQRAEENFYRMLMTTVMFLDVADETHRSEVPGSAAVREALEDRLERMLKSFQDAAGSDPVALRDAAWSHEHVGDAYFRNGQYAKAEQKFRTALALYEGLAAGHPEDATILYPLSRCQDRLSFVLYAMGRDEEARNEYRRTAAQFRLRLRLDPDWRCHADFAKFLCLCPMTEFRNPEEALQLARRALELPKGHYDYAESACWGILGLAHYRNGNWHEAITSLQEGARLRGGGAADGDSFLLAMAHYRLGETDRAKEDFERGTQWMPVKNLNRFDPLDRLLRAEAAELLGVKESPPPIDQKPAPGR